MGTEHPGGSPKKDIMRDAVFLAILGCALGAAIDNMASPVATGKSADTTAAKPATSELTKRQGFFGSSFRSNGSPQGRDWGPKAYGPGLNNRFAFPVNPFVMERALSVADRVPGTLVRVDIDGEVQFTDQHGLEVEILDWFGNDIGESATDFEDMPFGFPGMGGFGMGLPGPSAQSGPASGPSTAPGSGVASVRGNFGPGNFGPGNFGNFGPGFPYPYFGDFDWFDF